MRRPGFLFGFTATIRALRYLVFTPQAWVAAAVPALLFLALATTGIWLSLLWVVPKTVEALGLENAVSWYEVLGQWAVRLFSSLLAIIAGTWLSLVLTPPLSAPALEKLVAMREAELGAPSRRGGHLVQEIICGLKAQMLAVAFSTPLLVILWLVDIIVPPAVTVTLPLRYLVLAAALAWNMLDYPLTLRHIGPQERLSFVGSNLRVVLGYGLALALFAAIPGFGLLVLPVAVLAATELMWQLLALSPSLLPDVPRAEAQQTNSD